MVRIDELPALWRERAETVARFGAVEIASTHRGLAAELEAALLFADEAVVNLQAAAAHSGYTAGHLRRLIDSEMLRDYGRKYAPRVRIAELPIKPGHLPPGIASQHVDDDRLQIARSIVNRE